MTLQFALAGPRDILEFPLRAEDATEVSEGWRESTVALAAEEPVFLAHDELGPVALFGASMMDGMVSPWLLCSDRLGRNRAAVLRHARALVAERLQPLADSGQLIYNFIPKDSPGNRRFVQALGFRILPSPRDGFDFFYLPCANQRPS